MKQQKCNKKPINVMATSALIATTLFTTLTPILPNQSVVHAEEQKQTEKPNAPTQVLQMQNTDAKAQQVEQSESKNAQVSKLEEGKLQMTTKNSLGISPAKEVTVKGDILIGNQFSWSLKGYDDIEFAKLNFNKERAQLQIELKENNQPHWFFKEIYASIKIQNSSGQVLYDKAIHGTQKVNAETNTIPVKVGDFIRFTHLEGRTLKDSRGSITNVAKDLTEGFGKEVTYQVTKEGLKIVDRELGPGMPEANEVKDTDTKVTGTAKIGADVIVKAGEKQLGIAKVDKEGKYSVNIEPQKSGTKLSVTAKNSGGISLATEVTVKETAPDAPKVNEVKDTDTKVTGTAKIGADVIIKTGEKQLGTAKVDKEGKYSVNIEPQKSGTKLSVTAKNSAGESKATEIEVQKSPSVTTSKFELGYWQNYGLIYEGQINNDDWDMKDSSRISKDIQILNEQKEIVKTVKAVNTNWYEPGKYNGYQCIITNDVLGGLPEGNFTLRMQVKIDGEVKGETDLELKQPMLFAGPMHDNYGDLEQIVEKGKVISPKIINNNQPGIHIAAVDRTAKVPVFKKYWNTQDRLVFNGYFNTDENLEGTKKIVTIFDEKDKEVAKMTGLNPIASPWEDVSTESTFQAIIPKEFSDQKKYKYKLSIENSEGKEIFGDFLN
ncbi:Ig-like domain-containing protein [Bacillus thuringiensis]|uniref:Bacterial Ig domain-containing protein n=1 Tax=Bacillus thuringiensis TaxID=1428 RepID=A0A9X6Y9V9_BACTU|nr:Ig-like domain-containing protein [Bacillus thuringiensis]PEA88696.1 hypothetical protein CON71_17585 [Bacillus thuringiensis]